MPKRPASPLDECLPRRIPPDDPSRVTVMSLAQAGWEKFTDKLQFDVVSTGKQASVLVVGCKTFHWNPPAGILSRIRQLFDQGRHETCVTTRHTKICLLHRITCLSRYFAQCLHGGNTAFDTLCTLFTLDVS